MIVIKLFSVGEGVPLGYLQSCNFEAGNDEVTGDVKATRFLDKAMTFPDIAAAVAYRQTQSVRVPLRPDGQPNCPLTKFTMEFKVKPIKVAN